MMAVDKYWVNEFFAKDHKICFQNSSKTKFIQDIIQ